MFHANRARQGAANPISGTLLLDELGVESSPCYASWVIPIAPN